MYAPNLVNEGYRVISPKLTVELNKSGSLEYILPPNNVMYDNVKKLKTIITAYQDNDEIFRGRVLHDDGDFYRKKKVYCEGELSFLLDSQQRPYTFQGDVPELFRKYVEGHNARVDPEKQFEDIMTVKNEIFSAPPYPNWTAVGVTWLAGFDFEIKVIARIPEL